MPDLPPPAPTPVALLAAWEAAATPAQLAAQLPHQPAVLACLTELAALPHLDVNVDAEDAGTVLRTAGAIRAATATASGPTRTTDALRQLRAALPVAPARHCLLSVLSAPATPLDMDELSELTETLHRWLTADGEMIFGHGELATAAGLEVRLLLAYAEPPPACLQAQLQRIQAEKCGRAGAGGVRGGGPAAGRRGMAAGAIGEVLRTLYKVLFMRQLRISKQPTAPDPAQTQPLLQHLVATYPLPLSQAAQEQLLRYLVAVARQYRGHGARWADLLAAGSAGAIHCLRHNPDPESWLTWWVRQEISRTGQVCQHPTSYLDCTKFFARSRGAGSETYKLLTNLQSLKRRPLASLTISLLSST